MRTPLYWHNVIHRKARTMATLAGVSFAILLIYMQVGFYQTGKATATLVHRLFDYDLVVTSSRYVFLLQPGRLPRARLQELRGAEGVAEVMPVYIGTRAWQNTLTHLRADVLVIGV
ncbi:MAG TPA: hypothetical protein VGQ33_14040, partial [Vicinamibacteria bacterium]|nr:hypothetical protein [Vicinamibacteria bacterium]